MTTNNKNEIIETIIEGDAIASIVAEAEGFKDYNSIRFWNNSQEIYFHDLKMVIYQNNEEILSFKDLIKDALDHQIIIDTKGKLTSLELVEEAIKTLLDDEVHSKYIKENDIRNYIEAIAKHVEDEGLNLCNINIRECEICSSCQKVLLPDDECYEKHDGESLCSKCSIMCESCDSYFIEAEGIRDIENNFCCLSCLPAENIDFYTNCVQVDDDKFIAEVRLYNRIENEYITFPKRFEFKTMKEAELFASEVFKIKTAKIQDVKDLYSQHQSIKSPNINGETKEDFIESIIRTADYGEDIIEIPFGSNKFAVIGDDKAVYFNSHNEEQMKFKTIHDFASWYYEDDNSVIFQYQINLGIREDGKDVFTDEKLSKVMQDAEEDGSVIWSIFVETQEENRVDIEFPILKSNTPESDLDYFHPLAQQCKVISFPQSEHYLLEDKNYKNIFGYKNSSLAIVQDVHGNAYEIKVEEIERFTHWHDISVNGEDYNFELYNGAIDEKPHVYTHLVIDDGEIQEDIEIISTVIENIKERNLQCAPTDTNFGTEGTLCYVWNNDSNSAIIDIVYSNSNEEMNENNVFHTFNTCWDNASVIHHSDEIIEEVAKNAISRFKSIIAQKSGILDISDNENSDIKEKKNTHFLKISSLSSFSQDGKVLLVQYADLVSQDDLECKIILYVKTLENILEELETSEEYIDANFTDFRIRLNDLIQLDADQYIFD